MFRILFVIGVGWLCCESLVGASGRSGGGDGGDGGMYFWFCVGSAIWGIGDVGFSKKGCVGLSGKFSLVSALVSWRRLSHRV